MKDINILNPQRNLIASQLCLINDIVSNDTYPGNLSSKSRSTSGSRASGSDTSNPPQKPSSLMFNKVAEDLSRASTPQPSADENISKASSPQFPENDDFELLLENSPIEANRKPDITQNIEQTMSPSWCKSSSGTTRTCHTKDTSTARSPLYKSRP